MSSIKTFQALVRPARRMTSNAGPQRKYAPVSKEFRAKQEHFQMDNGLLVHLRGGMMDRFLFVTTIALTGLGLIGVVTRFYKMAYPQQPKH